MNLKQIILLTGLTIILIILFYTLLEGIDHHAGLPLLLLIAGVTLSDVILLARFYFRFVNTSGRKP